MKPFHLSGLEPGAIDSATRDVMKLYQQQPGGVLAALNLPPDTKLEEATGILRQRINEHQKRCEIYINGDYQVSVYRHDPPPPGGWPRMIHLSIKRVDRSTVHDWRDLQEIKNAIVGPDHEAVELYPAEDRKVDTANQYHLWVLADPTIRFPFGFQTGLVSDSIEGTTAQQRPMTKGQTT